MSRLWLKISIGSLIIAAFILLYAHFRVMPDLAVVKLDRESPPAKSDLIIGKVDLKTAKVFDADAVVHYNPGWRSIPAMWPVILPAVLIFFTLSIWGAKLWSHFTLDKELNEKYEGRVKWIEQENKLTLAYHMKDLDKMYVNNMWQHPEIIELMKKFEAAESNAAKAESRATGAEERAAEAQEKFSRLEGKYLQLKKRVNKG